MVTGRETGSSGDLGQPAETEQIGGLSSIASADERWSLSEEISRIPTRPGIDLPTYRAYSVANPGGITRSRGTGMLVIVGDTI